jgi:myo-inositol-1(or 4)-monophosphatase
VREPAPPIRHRPPELAALAVTVAEETAGLIRSALGVATGIGSKSSPTDIVTQTDLDAETLIRERLTSATPAAGFIGEEGGATQPSARLQWIVDPLDGTVNFLYDLPIIAVSIAGAVDGAVVAGAVVDVLRQETFCAATGHGATLARRPIRVSTCTSLDLALVTTGFSYRADVRRRQADVIHRLLPAARDIRCFGSAALQLCWVAAGRVDAYFERDTKIWDYAAAALVAEEAGALTELPCPENDGLVLGAPPAVFTELRELVQT